MFHEATLEILFIFEYALVTFILAFVDVFFIITTFVAEAFLYAIFTLLIFTIFTSIFGYEVAIFVISPWFSIVIFFLAISIFLASV